MSNPESEVYQMYPGEYIEERNIEEIAEKYLENDPIVKKYITRVYETEGSKKNHLYFDYELIDRKKIIQNYSPDQHKETIENINSFLEEVTGRGSELRKKDLKERADVEEEDI